MLCGQHCNVSGCCKPKTQAMKLNDLQTFEEFGALYMHSSMTHIRPDRNSKPVPLSHYYSTILNSLGHGICVLQKNISAAEGLEPVPTGSESTTLPVSYPGIYIPLSGSLRGPAGSLPMPWQCPPDIPYTVRPPVRSR